MLVLVRIAIGLVGLVEAASPRAPALTPPTAESEFPAAARQVFADEAPRRGPGAEQPDRPSP